MKLRLTILTLRALIIGAFLLMGQPDRAAAEDALELRAFWADGFSAGFKTAQQVDEMLGRLHDSHCNAIFAQVRKGGDAYYASHYEPWAKDDTAHFDALAYLIQQAHALQPPIQVHAWINTCAVGGNGTNPFNVVHLHPEWLSLNPDGVDFDGEATKIDPGNPGAADWTFRVYLDVARHYNVDGIHFDFVRYGGPTWGYNPVSVARFQQQVVGTTKPDATAPTVDGTKSLLPVPVPVPEPADADWKQWRRDQVTGLVRKVYAHAAAINPKIVVSAAVITWGDAPADDAEWLEKSAAMNRTMQDWRGWLQEGMIDLACPMTYFQADFHRDWQANWARFVSDHQYHRAATMAVGTWFNTIPQSLDLLDLSRAKTARGNHPYGVMLYCYSGTDASETKNAAGKRTENRYNAAFYQALTASTGSKSAPFTTYVDAPPLPWKQKPRAGILKGFVLSPGLDPIDGATVTLRGKRHITRRADGTGFYAFVDLPPGSYGVEFTYPGYQKLKATVKISAGAVTTQHASLGGASTPQTESLAAFTASSVSAREKLAGTPVRLQNLRVVIGTDTWPGNLYVMDGKSAGIRVHLAGRPLLPFQPGDVVAINGTFARFEDEPTIDMATVRLTDMVNLPTPPADRGVTAAGPQLVNGALPAGSRITVRGAVTTVTPEGFVLSVDGVTVKVQTGGRKDSGVEAKQFSLPTFAAGQAIEMTGIVAYTVNAAGEQTGVRLLPTDAANIHNTLP